MIRRLSSLCLLPLLAACGSASIDSGVTSTAIPTGQGRLALEIAAQSDQEMLSGGGKPALVLASLSEIIVDIDEVTAHSSEAGWVVLLKEPKRVDILKLADHAVELGFADLPPGKVTQIRLHVATDSSPYVSLAGGVTAPLDVPSGMQSGLKIKGLWDIDACQLSRVQARFDRKNAIHVVRTGHSDRHILRPVIFASGSSYEDAPCGESNDPSGNPNDPSGDPTDPTGEPIDPSGDPTDPTGEPSDGEPDPGVEGEPDTGGESGPGDGVGEPGDGEPTGGEGTDGTGSADPNDPADGLCEGGEACAGGYECGSTGVCIPSF